MGPGARGRLLPAVLVAVLACGCSGAAPGPPGAVPAPAPGPVRTGTPEEQALAWTGSVCGALVPVVTHLTTAPPLDLRAPEATRTAYLTYLTDGIAVTDRARAAIAAEGSAPVVDGDVIAEQVRGDVADLRADLVEARRQVERVEPGSAAGLGRALVGGSRLINALINGAEVAGTVNRDPLLQDAYERAPECAQLQRSGETPPPEPAPVPAQPTR